MTDSKGTFIKDGKITYQWAKQKTAMKFAKQYIPDFHEKTFVDIGAHVGLWSMWWGKVMNHVVAFEPIPEMCLLYEMNCRNIRHSLHETALSDEFGEIELHFNPENTGNTHTAHDKDVGGRKQTVIVRMLDQILPPILGTSRVGAMKIDCEGFEEKIVRGAKAVIEAHKPLIIVEQKKGTAYYGFNPTGAADYLETLGYQTLKVMSGDHIMVHKDYLP